MSRRTVSEVRKQVETEFREFVLRNEELLSDEVIALITDNNLACDAVDEMGIARAYRELLAVAVDLIEVKATQQQAEGQDRHAKAMRVLTRALVLFTAVQVLDQVGLWSWLATRAWPTVFGWITTLPNLVK